MKLDAQSPILMFSLMRATYWFDEGLRRALRARGVRPLPRAQSMLVINVALGLRKQTQLAEALGISRQAVNRIVGDLVEAGALIVTPDPDDGRGMVIELAPTINEDAHDTLKIIATLERKLGDLIGEDRLGVLRTALTMDWGEPDLG